MHEQNNHIHLSMTPQARHLLIAAHRFVYDLLSTHFPHTPLTTSSYHDPMHRPASVPTPLLVYFSMDIIAIH